MLLDCGVHRVWGKVQFAGPRHSTIIKRYLGKQRGVGKRGEHSSLWRMHHARHIYDSGEAIGKRNPQPETGKNFDGGYTPRRPRHNLRI
jgi:hypothetical protein